MKREILKKLGCFGMMAAMVLPLAACGKGSQKDAEATKIDKEHIYAYQDVADEESWDEVRKAFYCNDRLYIIGMSYQENNAAFLYSCNLDGTNSSQVRLLTGLEEPEKEDDSGNQDAGDDSAVPMPRMETQETDTEETDTEEADSEEADADGTADGDVPPLEEDPHVNTSVWMNYFAMNSEGSIYAIAEYYRESQDETGEFISENDRYLVCWNEAGEQQWRKSFKELAAVEEDIYFNGLLCDKEDNLWTYAYQKMIKLDKDGNILQKADYTEEDSSNLQMGKDGKIYLIGWNNDYSKQLIKTVDSNTLAQGEPAELPEAMANKSVFEGDDVYDFYLMGSNVLYGYNLGDSEPLEIMDLIDSDLASYGLNQVQGINETQFIGVYNDLESYKARVAVFTKVKPEDVKEKQAISLACYYLSSDMRKRIIEFNKTNDQYRIQISDYSQYATNDDYRAGYTQLNNDIIAGKVPDMLMLDNSMPIDSYIAKGLFADLNTFIEQDAELNREDYLENILEAYSVDGKLYQLVPQFSVFTVLGKSSIVGTQQGWTLEELNGLMEQQPEGTQIFGDTVRDTALYYAIMMTSQEFIDNQKGTCSFDSEAFIELLKFVSQFPQEIDYNNMDENYWQQQESAFRENRVLLLPTNIYRMADFNRTEKGTFGEEVTMIGFPTSGRNGNAIMGEGAMALSSKSAGKEGAWEFMRYYLTDEYQDNIGYSFPIKKSALEKQAQEAMERPYYENEDGTKEYYDDYVYIDGVDLKLEPMTREEVDELIGFISGLSQVAKYEENLANIIKEEAEAFFSGQKTPEEVAKIIQSRAKIYISENR